MPYKDRERQRAFQRDHCREKRAQALVGRHCERCESTDELEFHHRDPSEKISHRIWSWSWERIAKELEKCQVLCSPCHKAETKVQRRAQALARNPHGTRARHDLGCRCTACAEAKREYNRAHPPKRLVLSPHGASVSSGV